MGAQPGTAGCSAPAALIRLSPFCGQQSACSNDNTSGCKYGNISHSLYGLTNQQAEDAKRNSSTRTRTKRTLPDIKAEGDESLLDELVDFDLAANEAGVKKGTEAYYHDFRAACQSNAKTQVELGDPAAAKALQDEDWGVLDQLLVAALEEAAGLTTERKVQIALQKFSTAKMRSHTIEAAEQFLQAYTKGRLYMARAKLLAASMEPVQGDESALILHQREIHEFKEALSEELRYEMNRQENPPKTVAKAIAEVRRWMAAAKSSKKASSVNAIADAKTAAVQKELDALKKQLDSLQSTVAPIRNASSSAHQAVSWRNEPRQHQGSQQNTSKGGWNQRQQPWNKGPTGTGGQQTVGACRDPLCGGTLPPGISEW